MKSLGKALLPLSAATLLLACNHNADKMKVNDWKAIPDVAYAKGVSAPFCGVVQDVLLLAGGANFPDKPLLDGGTKRVYDDIWVKAPGLFSKWVRAGHLPDSTAYGATFPMGESLILAGGNSNGAALDKVYELRLSYGKAQLRTLPQLPVPLEQAGCAHDGDHLFLVGGVTTDGAASDGVYMCQAGQWEWKRVATLPQPLVQPVAFAAEGFLYVWGGFNPQTLEVPSEGWKLSQAALLGEAVDPVWEPAPGVPDGGTFVGATGVPTPDCRLLVVGGVNREIFARALHNGPEDRIPYLSQSPEAYRFRKEVFLFDPSGETWISKGSAAACALAGPGVAVRNAHAVYVAGGELKPGVRSPKIFELTF